MNQIRKIQQLSELELAEGTPVSASWHQDYKNSSYIYIGGLPEKMNEMDILIVFSQYGVPTDLKVIRDIETGKSKRFAFLKYEDFRSTILAVDNLNGYEIAGSKLKVDHARYHPFEYSGEDDANIEWDNALHEEMKKDFAPKALAIEEKPRDGDGDDAGLQEDEDLADPMAEYISAQKEKHRHHRQKHRHHHHHRHSEGAQGSS